MKNGILRARRVHSGFFRRKKHKLQSCHFVLRLLGAAINIYNMTVIKKWQLGITRDKVEITSSRNHTIFTYPNLSLGSRGKEKLKES